MGQPQRKPTDEEIFAADELEMDDLTGEQYNLLGGVVFVFDHTEEDEDDDDLLEISDEEPEEMEEAEDDDYDDFEDDEDDDTWGSDWDPEGDDDD